MSDKLLTLQELSDYLKINEEKVDQLVKEGVISAYKIGGEILRFRIEHIEAVRDEINSRVNEGDRIKVSEARKKVKERMKGFGPRAAATGADKIADFFYFNDFYIVSVAIIAILIAFILKG
jgi:excisionase family DNA binding protein